MIVGIPITEGSPEYLKWPLKDSDKEEIKAVLGREDYSEVVLMSCLLSHQLWRMEIDGVTEGVYGLRFMTKYRAVIWFLSSPKIYQRPKEFMKFSKEVISSLESGISYYNVVPKWSTRTIKWLRALGFNFYELNDHLMYFHLDK